MTKLEIAIKLRDQDDCALSHKTTADEIREYTSKCENTFEAGETILVSFWNDRNSSIPLTFCYYARGANKPYITSVKDFKSDVFYGSWKYAWKKEKKYIPYTEFDRNWINKQVKGKSTDKVYTIVGKRILECDVVLRNNETDVCHNIVFGSFLENYSWGANIPCGKIEQIK